MPPSGRTRSRRWARISAISLAVVAIGIQFIRPARSRGELPSDGRMSELVAVPASVDSLLRRSCYDCHSDNTYWPWYAGIAPVSWLLVRDVRHGRSNLDFSRWSLDTIREPTPRQRFQWMCRDARRGIMPPRSYLIIHPRAKLTDSETNVLCAWAQQRASAPSRPDGQAASTH